MSKRNAINAQMKQDLISAYREVAPKCWRQWDAYKRTVTHPAPRFYVTPKQAYQKVKKALEGDTSEIERMKPNRQRLYMCLCRLTIEATQERKFQGKSLWYIMPFIVTRPAPEFYITPKHLGFLFNEYQKEKRKMIGRT